MKRPRAKEQGGTNLLENLRFVCRDANYARHAMTDAEFYQLCKEAVAMMAPWHEHTDKGAQPWL